MNHGEVKASNADSRILIRKCDTVSFNVTDVRWQLLEKSQDVLRQSEA